ncbi:hypothetical protein AB1N83_009438 [Pleurotus pulmonarius]|nr:hypothetical protein EYR38_009170 [Pleurotus pulmonarius]
MSRSMPYSVPTTPLSQPPIAISVAREEIRVHDIQDGPESILVHDFNQILDAEIEEGDPLPPIRAPGMPLRADINTLPAARIRWVISPESGEAERLLVLDLPPLRLRSWVHFQPEDMAYVLDITKYRGRYVQLKLQIFPAGTIPRMPLFRTMWVKSWHVKMTLRERIRAFIAIYRDPHFYLPLEDSVMVPIPIIPTL